MSKMLGGREARDGDRTKTILVPNLGEIVFEMRHGDRRNGIGTVRIEPSDRVRDGFGVMKGFGARRSVLVYWTDNHGRFHAWHDGPEIGHRGRASGRYGQIHAQAHEVVKT